MGKLLDAALIGLMIIGIIIGIFTGLWIVILPLGALAGLFGWGRKRR